MKNQTTLDSFLKKPSTIVVPQAHGPYPKHLDKGLVEEVKRMLDMGIPFAPIMRDFKLPYWVVDDILCRRLTPDNS